MKKMKKGTGRLLTGVLMTALLFSMTGCGQKEEAPAAEQAVQESTEVALEEVINPEEVKTEVEELPAEATTEEVTEPVTEPVAEQDVIDKPVPTDADSQAKEEADARKEEKEEQEPAGSDLSILDGVMTLDGMELSFPIELSNMTLGKWTLSYKDVEDPSAKTLYPGECVEATMTCADYTSDHPFSMFRRLMSALAPHSYLAMAATMLESALWSPYSRRGASAAIPVCRATKRT